jgi:hypothetical protein
MLLLSFPAISAELSIRFDDVPVNEAPPGFTNVLYGKGRPGEWKVIMDDVPPLIAPATPQAPVVTRKPVLAQLSIQPIDERFPLLLYEKETFDDFTLTTKFKIVEGVIEQLAGVVFRVQNPTNFYVIRANAMDNSLRFYKVVDGARSPMVGPSVAVARNVWHDLKIECKGNGISAWLNDKPVLPLITDGSFSSGRIGFWTKSDAISYFADTTITYVPREPLAYTLVRQSLEKYPRLVDLRICRLEAGEARVLAAKKSEEVGTAATRGEYEALSQGKIMLGKGKSTRTVALPLRDRNGDPIAAVTITMKTFTGQTDQNTVLKAMAVVKDMQKRVQTLKELAE